MSGPENPDVAGDWLAAMRRGDWEQAWRATDRIELPRRTAQRQPGFVRRPEHLCWDGTPLAGRSVLVRCEHGLGDTLQFMRFVPHLQAAHVSFMVQPPLVELLRDAPGLGDVRNYWTDDPLPAYEVDIEVMELAYAMRMTPERLPPPYPGLHRRVAEVPRLELPDDPRLRVALLWAASEWDTSRSVPLRALAALFALEEVQYFSLQQGTAAADPLLQRLDVECLSPRTADVRAAAAAMEQMDLVLCVDAMPAHLAGTLGRPTWVLLKHQADWRWMEGREDSPWYPTVRLFRQPSEGDWTSVVEEVARALRKVCLVGSGAAHPSAAARFRSGTPAVPSRPPSPAR